MANLPKGMSWSEFLKFVEQNPKYTLSEATGAPIKGRPTAETPKMVPPADPFAGLTSAAEGVLARARGAGTQAADYLTKPQPVVNPKTGYQLQNVPPAKGEPLPRPDLPFGAKLTEFTPGQRAAQGAAGVGALTGAGYLGSTAADRRAAMPERGYEGDSPRERIAVTTANDIINRQREAADRDYGIGDMKFSDETYSAAPAKAIMAQRPRMPLPPPRPAALDQAAPAAEQGILSKIFGGDPYKGMSSAKLMEQANRGDDAAAFFRADEALRRERPEMFAKKLEDQGMATGGAAKPHKDAALHKALEIIHHLISRR